VTDFVDDEVPLEVLKDFAAFEELLMEVTKQSTARQSIFDTQWPGATQTQPSRFRQASHSVPPEAGLGEPSRVWEPLLSGPRRLPKNASIRRLQRRL